MLAAGSDEAELVCGDRGLGAVAWGELVQYGCDVGLDGAFADIELVRDLGVGAASRDLP